MDDDRLFRSGQDVLVVALDLKKAVSDDMYVTVVGQVKRFCRTDATFDLERFGLRPAIVSGFQDRPVIVASSIRTAAGEELLPGS